MAAKITIGKNRDRKAKAMMAWATLKDKTAFEALTQAQRDELIRRALVYLIKDKLGNDAQE